MGGGYVLLSTAVLGLLVMMACTPGGFESSEKLGPTPSASELEEAPAPSGIPEAGTIADESGLARTPDPATVSPGGLATPQVQATSVPHDLTGGPSLAELSVVVAAIPTDIPDYDRDEWSHWLDEDRDCLNTRHEVLLAESLGPVTYTDSDQCKIASGSWVGPFTRESFDDPRALDVDHMVPLKNAHLSGGWAWDRARKADYANDLSYEGHLIAVDRSANRSKGSSGPEDWRPLAEDYWCQYAVDWVTIKDAWTLTVSEPEAAALMEMLDTCTLPRTLVVVRSSMQRLLPVPSSTPALDVIYRSCEEAESAGEPLVQGSEGSGQGFPEAKVPSARDGDGDGVVCERR